MTRLVRLLGAAPALVVMAAPVIALAVASILAIEPPDGPRATIVHWGLTLSDPFARDCLVNSVGLAVVVVSLASAVGVAIGRISWGRRGWRGAILLTSIRLGAACHPLVMAIAWLVLVDRVDPSARGFPEAGQWLDAPQGRWLLLGLAQFGFASSWVAWWTGRALERVGPDCVRVAALSGASRRWIWRTALWPLVRPTVARASASVFAVLVIEPGGPLVLGLRRSIGAQVVTSLWMTSRGDLARAAILGVLAMVVSLLVRVALRRWGGPDHLAGMVPTSSSDAPMGAVAPPGRFRSAVAALGVLCWAAVALGPALFLVVASVPSLAIRGEGAGLAEAAWRGLAPMLGASLAVGGASALVAMVVAWPLSAVPRAGSAVRVLDAVPPLAIGVGLFCLWKVSGAWSGADPMAGAMSRVGRLVDPYATPWLLVSWGTALVHLPWAVSAARSARGIDARALRDEARVAGRRVAFSRTLLFLPIASRRCAAPALGVALLAASGLSPALVLTPLEPFRPMAAWVLRDAMGAPGSGPGPGPGVLAALVSPMLGLLLLLRRGQAPDSPTVLRG
ncbi:ABC transporter permease subunit [Tautonia sp. JC769]|uniref:ABC transporter permease subunit n=1 Tax=Tautonia sp. JC769 TaxID=3232135 RepID=UPI003457F62D